MLVIITTFLEIDNLFSKLSQDEKIFMPLAAYPTGIVLQFNHPGIFLMDSIIYSTHKFEKEL